MKVFSLAVCSLVLAGVGFGQVAPATNAVPAQADVLPKPVVAVYGNEELWYDKPAATWTEALPVGNGRLGAMAFGGMETDKLSLNEETIWTGGPLASDNGGATREQIDKARELVFSGKAKEALALLPERFLQTSSYQPFGDLVVKTALPEGETTDYRRSLSLDEAVARTSFVRGGVTYRRETFASFTDDVIVDHLSADQEGAVSFEATLASPHGFPCEVEEGLLVVRGETGEAPRARAAALAFEGAVAVWTQGGTVSVEDGKIAVSHADEATLFVAIATNYENFRSLKADPAKRVRTALAAAVKVPYGAAKKAHTAFYRAQADRCTLTLGACGSATQPTDVRIRDFAETDDPTLAALAFRYGRYLLISSSQPGAQPANLQGIWNKDLKPAWRSNWTLNINAEMNYWPAEVTGLGDLAEPLWRLCDELSVTGGDIARKMYGAEGWTAHHNTDLWRVASPCSSPGHGLWPTGGAWLSLHIWDHWRYTRDRDFLAGHYATLKGAADFLLSVLVRNPQSGRLTICPGVSPENTPKQKDAVGFTTGAAMDRELARDLLTAVAEATKILGGDEAYAARLRATAADLEPLHVGAWGQLQEWSQDLDDPADTHRHVSHLYAVYPSNQITPETPELFEAAKVSLLARGEDSTGWGLAWRMCLWARLLDGDHAYRFFRQLMRPSERGTRPKQREQAGVYKNLFDSCPPFEIDGNFGWTAGVVEMLLQAHRGPIDLLPALPKAWPQGHVKGLRAPGGFTVEILWMEGKLVQARVKSDLGEPCTVRYQGKTVELTLKKGESILLTADDFLSAGADKKRAPSAHFWETRPLKEGFGFTWSMTTRIGDMLVEAEKLFGARDRAWTILGAEIRADGKGVPQNWFPGYPARKDIVFQVVPPADTDRAEAVFQLAHEVIHCLAPTPGERATVLEEGVADWFSVYYARKAKGADIHSSLPSYRKAHALVAQLLARDHEAVFKLRQVEPCFGRMTAATFEEAGVEASEEEIAALLAPFNR